MPRRPKGYGQLRIAVLLVGWDDSRGTHGGPWKMRIPGGPQWGEQGFMWDSAR